MDTLTFMHRNNQWEKWILISLISQDNKQTYYNLTQAYEGEFSRLTLEVPDEQGRFPVQTDIDQEHIGYLIYEGATPIGFMVFAVGDVKDVSEFYIIPSKRMGGYGQRLAEYVFALHPGRWQVRQLLEAEGAQAFWRKVVDRITGGDYREEQVQDPEWGYVFRQSFVV